MPTMADLLQWAVKTFGEGVLHKNAQATRGGDYLQREEALQSQQMDAATRRAMQLGNIEKERARTAATAAQGRAEFPELGGAGDEEAATRLELMRGAKDRELAEALKLAQIDTEAAQQAELGARHQPKQLSEEERILADLKGELLLSEAEENRAQAGLANRKPGVTPPRATQPKPTTGLDLARLQIQAERAGLTVEEMQELMSTASSGPVSPGKDTTPSKGATVSAGAAPKKGELPNAGGGGEVASRQQFDALPVGARFTKGGRPCVKVNASQMDCK